MEPRWRSKQKRIWSEGRKPVIEMTKRQTGFLKEEVHVMMNKKKGVVKEGEIPIVILNQARKLPIKEKDHTVKKCQGRRLPRGY